MPGNGSKYRYVFVYLIQARKVKMMEFLCFLQSWKSRLTRELPKTLLSECGHGDGHSNTEEDMEDGEYRDFVSGVGQAVRQTPLP